MKHSQAKKSRGWLWILIIAVILIGGGIFWYHQTYATSSNDTASSLTSSKHSSSQSTVMGSSDSSKTSATSSTPATANHGPKLSQDIGPRETAAAILYYGGKKLGNDMFDGTWNAAIQSQQLQISIGKLDGEGPDHLQDPGMGALYTIAPGQTDASVGYTLGQDGTVYFYNVTNPTKPMQEIGQASKSEIIHFANQYGGVSDIQKLGNGAQINGDV